MDTGGAFLCVRSTIFGSAWPEVLLLLATFLIRVIDVGQPIVENYVGRQVPTAMVARNLERGSGLLRPQLDTGPFPNYFLVEPPLYQCGTVALRRATGLALEEAGRVVSALATTFAAWGLLSLVRAREGRSVALLSVAAFAVFPLTVRYGRAFQPDAAMLGASVAGLACWDRYESGRSRPWMVAGWLLLATGFAIKLTAGFLLIPLWFAIVRGRRPTILVAACSTVFPALLWYAWAFLVVDGGEGSRASADNRAIWLGLTGPAALARPEALKIVLRLLVVRAFTPLGLGLALLGLLHRRDGREENLRLWWVWGISGLAVMAVLAEKLHHEYYWLILAPVAAVGVARGLDRLRVIRRGISPAVAGVLLLLCWFQARSTWSTPADWVGLGAAARSVSAEVPRGAWVVAPEALLFQADRRGCRLEWTPSAARRAAGEWGDAPEVQTPLDLVDYYRRRGARYFADLGAGDDDPRRKGLHDAVRRRYKVIVDRPEVLIVHLVVAEMNPHAN